MILRSTMALVVAAVCAAGCGERPQTITPAKKADAKPWEGAQGGNVAEGWKPGEQASWEAQMRQRAQAQNEYSRSAATAAASAPTQTP